MVDIGLRMKMKKTDADAKIGRKTIVENDTVGNL